MPCQGSSFSADGRDITPQRKSLGMISSITEGVALVPEGPGVEGSGKPGGLRRIGRSVKVASGPVWYGEMCSMAITRGVLEGGRVLREFELSIVCSSFNPCISCTSNC